MLKFKVRISPHPLVHSQPSYHNGQFFLNFLLTSDFRPIIFRDLFLDGINIAYFPAIFFIFSTIPRWKGVIPMLCATIKKDTPCAFMTGKGCSYKGGICYQIVEQCKGCNRGAEFSSGWYCTACPDPSIKWKSGRCNLATHVAAESVKETTKINPLKASKRRGR